MPLDRFCLACGSLLGNDWTRRNQKYCDEKCLASFWYFNKYKKVKAERYQKLKRQWERSESGKRAGVPIRQWLKLPKDWR